MTIYLDEQYFGADRDIVYPNVQTCVALAAASTGGGLVGMHITKTTSSSELQRAGEIMLPLLNGDVAGIVCIGNVKGFVKPQMQFPGTLRSAIQSALRFSGVIRYFDTGPLYKATTDGGGSGGVVVRAWRDDVTNAVRYACGPHTSYAAAGSADIAAPIYRVNARPGLLTKDGDSFDLVRVHAMQKYEEDGQPRTKQQTTYRLDPNALMSIPTLAMASL